MSDCQSAYGYIAENNDMKFFLLRFLWPLLGKCVLCLLFVRASIKARHIDTTKVNALHMGLISDSAHSDAWRKKAVTGDWRYFVIFRSKLDPYQDDLLYVRVISSSHNFFYFFVVYRKIRNTRFVVLGFLLQLLVCLLLCFLLNYYYYTLHEVTWCMLVWWTQNAPRWQQFHVAPAMPAL